MFGYEDINLTLTFPVIYLFLSLFLIAAYSFYVYRYTIPQIQPFKKIVLVTLRVLALLILCLILFEPILNLSKKLTLEPSNFVFIDNSRSIRIDDGTNRLSTIKKIVNDFSVNASESNLTFYEFGNSVKPIDVDSLDKLNFSDGATNLQDVFKTVQNSEKNIASVTIVSDGVITSGSNPYYDAINLGIPVFTIGIGDTTQHTDVEIKKVLHNDIVYVETPTNIISTISNKGFSGDLITAALYEDNKFISQQTVKLSPSGIQNITFDYSPQSSGEKNLVFNCLRLKVNLQQQITSRYFMLTFCQIKLKSCCWHRVRMQILLLLKTH